MKDNKHELCMYRLQQAEETLIDAQRMLQAAMSPRSIINRAYYVMFYSLLALFLHLNIPINTSKHKGIISVFDKECVHKGIIATTYSRMLHNLFESRQDADYKEFINLTPEDAAQSVRYAQDFMNAIKMATGAYRGNCP